MEIRKRNRQSAFSLLELIVVLVISAFLAYLILTLYPRRPRNQYRRSACVNNLKQIGVAYRVWANDNGDKYPALVLAAATNGGGWQDFLTNQNAGAWAWTNYAIMQNELGQSPRVLLCPADEREAATNFVNIHNTNISYFIGAGANDTFPQSILGGDRNLNPGAISQRSYGYSVITGAGNDVAIQTNSVIAPVSWSLNMHSEGNPAGAGNILLGDASVQQANSAGFRTNYQANALDAGNWPSNHVPTAPSFRLIFP